MSKISLIVVAALALTSATVTAHAAHKRAVQVYEERIMQDSHQEHFQQQSGSGVTVEEVVPNTAAASAGLRPGDVIAAVNGNAVTGYSDIDARVAASGGRPLSIDVYRGGRHLRLRAAPRPMLVRSPFGEAEQRRVLGVAHTEGRLILMPCAEDPDCE